MATISTDQLLQNVHEHLAAFRLAEAEQGCRQILSLDPQHAEALHLLGLIAMQVEKPGVAIDLISRAVLIDSSQAEYFNNLGNAYLREGQTDKAIEAWQRCLE